MGPYTCRNHLHHLMLDAGYSPTRAALAMGVASFLLGAAAVCAARAQMPAAYQIALFFILVALRHLLPGDRQRAGRVLRLWSGSGRERSNSAGVAH